MLAASTTASFYLPGLVHLFGNLLLTVQGHVLHLNADGIKRMQDAVLGAVQRGSAGLQVIRALLGEQTGAMGSAGDLLAQVVELGRVPAREWGVSLETRGAELKESIWLPAEPFVLACAEALRLWIYSIPAGSAGTVTIAIASDGSAGSAGSAGFAGSAGPAGALVEIGFEAAVGSLPFPIAAAEVVTAIQDQLLAANGVGRVLPIPAGDQTANEPTRIELRFGPPEPAAGLL